MLTVDYKTYSHHGDGSLDVPVGNHLDYFIRSGKTHPFPSWDPELRGEGELRVACIQGSLLADYEYDVASHFKPHCLDFAAMMAYTLGL